MYNNKKKKVLKVNTKTSQNGTILNKENKVDFILEYFCLNSLNLYESFIYYLQKNTILFYLYTVWIFNTFYDYLQV